MTVASHWVDRCTVVSAMMMRPGDLVLSFNGEHLWVHGPVLLVTGPTKNMSLTGNGVVYWAVYPSQSGKAQVFDWFTIYEGLTTKAWVIR